MTTRVLAMALAVALVAGPAAAGKMKSFKDQCLESVADSREMLTSEEYPRPSERTREQVVQLVEVAEHLCRQGSFKYADALLNTARGMVVTEN